MNEKKYPSSDKASGNSRNHHSKSSEYHNGKSRHSSSSSKSSHHKSKKQDKISKSKSNTSNHNDHRSSKSSSSSSSTNGYSASSNNRIPKNRNSNFEEFNKIKKKLKNKLISSLTSRSNSLSTTKDIRSRSSPSKSSKVESSYSPKKPSSPVKPSKVLDEDSDDDNTIKYKLAKNYKSSPKSSPRISSPKKTKSISSPKSSSSSSESEKQARPTVAIKGPKKVSFTEPVDNAGANYYYYSTVASSSNDDSSEDSNHSASTSKNNKKKKKQTSAISSITEYLGQSSFVAKHEQSCTKTCSKVYVDDLDQLQFQLESMLVAIERRKQRIQKESSAFFDFLQNRPSSKNRGKKDTIAYFLNNYSQKRMNGRDSSSKSSTNRHNGVILPSSHHHPHQKCPSSPLSKSGPSSSSSSSSSSSLISSNKYAKHKGQGKLNRHSSLADECSRSGLNGHYASSSTSGPSSSSSSSATAGTTLIPTTFNQTEFELNAIRHALSAFSPSLRKAILPNSFCQTITNFPVQFFSSLNSNVSTTATNSSSSSSSGAPTHRKNKRSVLKSEKNRNNKKQLAIREQAGSDDQPDYIEFRSSSQPLFEYFKLFIGTFAKKPHLEFLQKYLTTFNNKPYQNAGQLFRGVVVFQQKSSSSPLVSIKNDPDEESSMVKRRNCSRRLTFDEDSEQCPSSPKRRKYLNGFLTPSNPESLVESTLDSGSGMSLRHRRRRSISSSCSSSPASPTATSAAQAAAESDSESESSSPGSSSPTSTLFHELCDSSAAPMTRCQRKNLKNLISINNSGGEKTRQKSPKKKFSKLNSSTDNEDEEDDETSMNSPKHSSSSSSSNNLLKITLSEIDSDLKTTESVLTLFHSNESFVYPQSPSPKTVSTSMPLSSPIANRMADGASSNNNRKSSPRKSHSKRGRKRSRSEISTSMLVASSSLAATSEPGALPSPSPSINSSTFPSTPSSVPANSSCCSASSGYDSPSDSQVMEEFQSVQRELLGIRAPSSSSSYSSDYGSSMECSTHYPRSGHKYSGGKQGTSSQNLLNILVAEQPMTSHLNIDSLFNLIVDYPDSFRISASEEFNLEQKLEQSFEANDDLPVLESFENETVVDRNLKSRQRCNSLKKVKIEDEPGNGGSSMIRRSSSRLSSHEQLNKSDPDEEETKLKVHNEDQIATCLESIQSCLEPVCRRNQSAIRRIYKLTKKDIKLQELWTKLETMDLEIVDSYRSYLEQNRLITKKIRNSLLRKIEDRRALTDHVNEIVEQLTTASYYDNFQRYEEGEELFDADEEEEVKDKEKLQRKKEELDDEEEEDLEEVFRLSRLLKSKNEDSDEEDDDQEAMEPEK